MNIASAHRFVLAAALAGACLAPSRAASQDRGFQEPAAGSIRALADSLNSAGHTLGEGGRLDEAEQAYRRAVELREKAGDMTGVAASLNNIGNIFLDRARYDSALAWYDSSIAVARRNGNRAGEARTVGNRGLALRGLGLRDSAHAAFAASAATALELGDHSQVAANRFRSAELFILQDRPDSALHYFRQSLHHEREAGNSEQEGWVLLRIASLESAAGEMASAMSSADSAHRMFRQLADTAGVGAAELRIGQVYQSLGRLDSAMYHMQRSLAADRLLADTAGEAETLRAIASVQSSLGRYDSAAVYLERAAELYLASQNPALAAFALEAQGNALKRLFSTRAGAYRDSTNRTTLDSAVALYRRALSIAETAGASYERASILASIASAFWGWRQAEWNDRDSARTYALAALQAAESAGGDAWTEMKVHELLSGIEKNRDSALVQVRRAVVAAQRLGNARDLAARLVDLSEIHRELGAADSAFMYRLQALDLARRAKDPVGEYDILQHVGHLHKLADPPDWRSAAAYYDSAWVVLEGIRSDVSDDASRIAIAERFMSAARHLSSALLEVAAETGLDADRWLEIAAMERARARSLVDMMRTAETSAPTTDLAGEAESLRQALSWPGVATLSYAIGESNLFATLTLPGGEVVAAHVPVQASHLTRQVAAIRHALQADSADSRSVADLLEPEPVERSRGIAAQGVAELESVLATHVDSLVHFLLPDSIVTRLERDSSITDLVIVTDASIALMPFAVLPFGAGGTPLGSRFALRYAPSLTALVATERSTPAISREILVVGNPSMPSVRSASGELVRLEQLPGAEAEARRVASLLGGELLLGGNATEGELRRRMPRARIMHFATHGYAYAAPSRVRDSFIALAPGDGDDGLLTAGEVLDGPERLMADLVVLSACQTGLGSQLIAEGTVGLQRAFLAKGARSLLVSLWSVDDAVTERLMVRFYEHLLAGHSKGDALRRAQDDIRETHPNPRYWAAFQLVGAR